MHKWFPVLSAVMLLAACDQPQEQQVAPVTLEESAISVQAKTETEDMVQASSHTLTCDGDYSKAEGFDVFLAQLKQAVAAKDAAFIAQMADEDIRYNFGDGGGKAGFLADWKLDSTPEESPFWQEMENILRIGGYVETDWAAGITVLFPCTFRELAEDNWLRDGDQPFSALDYMVVIREDAVLKDNTGADFRQLAFGEVVKPVEGAQDRYATHDGLEGTISGDAVRSPLDYRAFFRKKDGEWKMPLFIAGD